MIDRIAVLGGSSVYIPEFIASILSHTLCVKEVVLIGRSESKLVTVSRFCQRIFDRCGFPAAVTPTTDLVQGLQGAEFVLNNVRVGGMAARLRDEKLPPRYGMVGDESLGAGGVANALRTLPVLFELAKAVEQACPNAVFINLTNPMGVCVEALTKYSSLNVIGICDLPRTYVKKVASLLRVNESEIFVDYVGLNHLGWIQDVRMHGRSCMGRVLERIEQSQEDGFDQDLIRLFRMIPIRTAGIFFHQDSILRQQQATARFRAEVLHEAEQQILRLYEDPHLSEIPELTRARNAVWYVETIVPLLKALTGQRGHRLILCVRNGNAIRDLPEDGSVEIPVRVSKKGLDPQPVGSCPRFLHGLFAAVKESDRLIIEAVRHRSYECALQSLAIHPLVPSIEAAREFLEQVIKDEDLELH